MQVDALLVDEAFVLKKFVSSLKLFRSHRKRKHYRGKRKKKYL